VPAIRHVLAATFLHVQGVPVIVSADNYDLAVLWATVIATPLAAVGIFLAAWIIRRSNRDRRRVFELDVLTDRRATSWVTTGPGQSLVAAARDGRLLLDGTAEPPQVPPEAVGRFGCPPRQVFAERCLLAWILRA
jgi:hypothetical protein